MVGYELLFLAPLHPTPHVDCIWREVWDHSRVVPDLPREVSGTTREYSRVVPDLPTGGLGPLASGPRNLPWEVWDHSRVVPDLPPNAVNVQCGKKTKPSQGISITGISHHRDYPSQGVSLS